MPALRVPVVIMRGGTSRGLYFHARDLPTELALQDRILSAALGSPDPFGRQINGLGGATSSTSKAVIVEKDPLGIADISYTFAQVDVVSGRVDRHGNCGNLTAGVAPFAIEEGLLAAYGRELTVRLCNKNTGKLIDAKIVLDGASVQEAGEFVLHGVPGSGSPIRLDFLQPGGAVTGRLLPTGNAVDVMNLEKGESIDCTIVDATNPVVFLRAHDFNLTGDERPEQLNSVPGLLEKLEKIRGTTAVKVELAPDAEMARVVSAAHPKIALVAPPRDFLTTDGDRISRDGHDILIRMISMGRAHQSIPLTGAMCAAVAAAIPGTLVSEAAGGTKRRSSLRIGHAAGTLSVGANLKEASPGQWEIPAVSVTRTARRLMEGYVRIPEEDWQS